MNRRQRRWPGRPINPPPNCSVTIGARGSNGTLTSDLLNIVNHRHITPEERYNRNHRVREGLLGSSTTLKIANFQSISNRDLHLLFDFLDQFFFDGLVRANCHNLGHALNFRLSKRMTSTGGMTTMEASGASSRTNQFEIAIATTLLFLAFRSDNPIKVGGLECGDRLDALQRIMEHEMVHLIEMMLWNDSNCREPRFRRIIYRFFAHVESNHQLLTPSDIAQREQRIRPGDRVQFRANGKVVVGYVNRITKRATVLVPDVDGIRYTDGQNYCKFYVPISQLRRC